jgi:prolyl-tRNA synthetase
VAVRLSKYLLPTLKEAPKDADLTSHKLLIRAGLIRPVVAGIYSYLPLGWKVLRKIEQIIREEMDAIGGQEVLMPLVQPASLWRESGRWYAYGPELVRFKDRDGRDMVLATTHEETITDIARQYIRSYRQLPMMLYHIQIKFRDEPRPRGGLIRVREFTMKDAYSFHASWEDMDSYYPKVYQAYLNIFKRCGLDTQVVEADPGPIGGPQSHEFILPTEEGEASFVKCTKCDYAANMEKASAAKSYPDEDELPLELEEVATPGCYTIEEVAKFLNLPKSKTAKAVFYKAGDELIFAVIRGDLEVNEAKLARAVSAGLERATEEEMIKAGAVPGYASPVRLKTKAKIRIIADDSIVKSKNLIAGANKEGFHLKGVNYSRDFVADVVADIAMVRPGDRCAHCGSELEMKRGIELGHIFKLGTKYSKAMGATFLDRDGEEKPFIMGCYGIGTGRLLAAVVEQYHDERGIIWPLSLAPFEVIVLVLNPDEGEQMRLGEEIYREIYRRLSSEGEIEVLLDDRIISAGVKFKDAELIGIPLIVVIGPQGMEKNEVELHIRKKGSESERRGISLSEGLDSVISALRGEMNKLT